MAGDTKFGARLAALRKQRGMTQTDLSRLVGVHYTHIGRYEIGRSMPSAETLKSLAGALGTTTDFLIDGATQDSAKNRLNDQELLVYFQQASQLPDEDKQTIKRFLQAFLAMQQIRAIAGGPASSVA